MSGVFISKVRPIGTSLCVILPKSVVQAENLASGKEIGLAVVHRNLKLLDDLIGTMKNAKPFIRDRQDRI